MKSYQDTDKDNRATVSAATPNFWYTKYAVLPRSAGSDLLHRRCVVERHYNSDGDRVAGSLTR